MNKLYLYTAALIAACTLIWLQAEPNLFSYTTFMHWRSALIQGTGIISLLLLTLTMLLALRLPLIDKMTAGLDKSYRLHKWLAIYGVIIGAIHWLLAIVPKKLVQYGVLERGSHARPQLDPESLQAMIMSLRGGAKSIGELALYAFVAFTLIALFAPIQYKRFKLTHKAMAIAFVVIAYHSVVLIKPAYWSNLITPITILLALVGVACALWSLLGKVGKTRRYQGSVTTLEYDQVNQTYKMRLAVPQWPGHNAGQFAFLTIKGEEPHPFTISSNSSEPFVEFTIKALGDFTTHLHQHVATGDNVEIEGPYGHFEFADNQQQVWVAGGIGIAAFKARLQQLKQQDHTQTVDLYYCTQAPSPQLVAELERLAKQAKVRFHLIDNRTMHFLTIDKIKSQIGSLDNVSVWFCGPTGFGQALKQQLKQHRFNLNHFHHELFNFR
ncbi:ferredoxin reductase family protein [Vibrio panuliri]|uniref:Oxidoreductase n=1 Tax=Vibrio panuliri TaxID=1381081 RepID=A0ABX3F4S7_9VIBR|nr:ferric reductase-like transmembrane domain-containing protein [Vibrio panuliri]OLQ84935.1 oxidoreductase [Vibrio panuliri]